MNLILSILCIVISVLNIISLTLYQLEKNKNREAELRLLNTQRLYDQNLKKVIDMKVVRPGNNEGYDKA